MGVHKVSILNRESILVGSNLTLEICQELKLMNKSAYVIVTDDNVAELHLQEFKQVTLLIGTPARIGQHKAIGVCY